VIIDKEEASQIAVEGIYELTKHLGRWKEIATVFPNEKRVRAAIVQLYQYVLDFLVSTTRYLGAHALSE
jgi:hypothetical protein